MSLGGSTPSPSAREQREIPRKTDLLRKDETMSVDIRNAFDAIGAEMLMEPANNIFEIDVRQNGGREVYRLTNPRADTILIEAVDVKPKLRHLVLDVSGWRLPIGGRFLCGHDEQHWFVATLPFDRKTMTVRGAMEALKPEIVRREQSRMGVKHRLYR